MELVCAPSDEPCRVYVDASQIEQVLVNLATNAREAMPGGGRLSVSVSQVELNTAGAVRGPEMPQGPYVALRVSDTGCGMDLETQAKIFEPFFTTKPRGQGLGLGLATVYGTVKQSGGFIYCDSAVGMGTTFTVYLPASSTLRCRNVGRLTSDERGSGVSGRRRLGAVTDAQMKIRQDLRLAQRGVPLVARSLCPTSIRVRS